MSLKAYGTHDFTLSNVPLHNNIVSSLIKFTPTFGLSNISWPFAWYQRINDSMMIFAQGVFTGTPAGTAHFTVPLGLTINSDKILIEDIPMIGRSIFTDISISRTTPGLIGIPSITAISFWFEQASTSGSVSNNLLKMTTSTPASGNIAVNDELKFEVILPILEWQ